MSEPGAVTIGPYRQGEIPPPIVVTYKGADQQPLDFSVGGSWNGRWIYRRHANGGNQTFASSDPAAAIRDATVSSASSGPTKGQATYPWVEADFDTPGDYEGEMWVGNSVNRLSSIHYVWRVNPALAVPDI
jgi:hypothetical protein